MYIIFATVQVSLNVVIEHLHTNSIFQCFPNKEMDLTISSGIVSHLKWNLRLKFRGFPVPNTKSFCDERWLSHFFFNKLLYTFHTRLQLQSVYVFCGFCAVMCTK